MLTVSPGTWAGEGPFAYTYRWQRCGSDATTNNALRGAATASRSLPAQPPAYAVDGFTNTQWGAGAFAPQWIEVDTQAPYLVSRIRLTISQLPDGFTDHFVYGRGPNPGDPYVLLHRFTGFTRSGDVLEYTPPSPFANVRSIRVWTVASPSWVGWVEIEAFSTCTDIEGAIGTSFLPGSTEVGSSVRAVVTAANAGGSTPSASALTGVVSARRTTQSPRCVVPRLRGKTLAAARRSLTRAHCRLGRVRRARSQAHRGRIISQSRRPGARLGAGTRVNVVMSRGPR